MSVSTRQQVGQKSADNSSLTLIFAQPTISGHEVHVHLKGFGNAPPPASFADSLGNVYHLESPACQIVGEGVFYDYVCESILGGAGHSITVTGTGLAGTAKELIRTEITPSQAAQLADKLDEIQVDLRFLNTLCANGFTGNQA